jgi:anti-sigma regulatory factor (Ser/Thr protein kinase)
MSATAARSGAAEGHEGYYHETAFYGSDDEFLDVVVPFLLDGVAAGEPTISTLAERNADLVRRAIGDASGVRFLSGSMHYARPTSTIIDYQQLFGALAAEGATQIRIVGDVPHPGFGVPWDSWARYEAVANHAFKDFPLWGLCPYDTRTTPAAVLEEVTATHPHVVGAGGVHRHNDAFEDPFRFLTRRLASQPGRPDPLELAPPALRLADPTPADARHAVAALATSAGLDPRTAGDLVTAVSEVVTNAITHGRPPMSLQAWAGDQRAVVAVSDCGSGPADPFAGLVRPERRPGEGGYGLWLAHQMCTDVRFGMEDGRFVVRLIAGEPETLTP